MGNKYDPLPLITPYFYCKYFYSHHHFLCGKLFFITTHHTLLLWKMSLMFIIMNPLVILYFSPCPPIFNADRILNFMYYRRVMHQMKSLWIRLRKQSLGDFLVAHGMWKKNNLIKCLYFNVQGTGMEKCFCTTKANSNCDKVILITHLTLLAPNKSWVTLSDIWSLQFEFQWTHCVSSDSRAVVQSRQKNQRICQVLFGFRFLQYLSFVWIIKARQYFTRVSLLWKVSVIEVFYPEPPT